MRLLYYEMHKSTENDIYPLWKKSQGGIVSSLQIFHDCWPCIASTIQLIFSEEDNKIICPYAIEPKLLSEFFKDGMLENQKMKKDQKIRTKKNETLEQFEARVAKEKKSRWYGNME